MWKARYFLISWKEMQDRWPTNFSMRTLSKLQVQDLITFCLLWTKKFLLWNGRVFPILKSLSIDVTFFCIKVLPMHFHSGILETGDFGGWGMLTSQPEGQEHLHSDVMTYASILAGASLLTLWSMLARGTKILTAEGLTCTKGHHSLSQPTTLGFTNTAAPRTLKQTSSSVQYCSFH